MNLNPEKIFGTAQKLGASDVHMSVGSPILFRINGELKPQMESSLNKTDLDAFIKTVLGSAKYTKFTKERGVDASYAMKDGARVRVNCLFDQHGPGLVGRLIPPEIPSLEDLRLKEIYENVCLARDGIVLFTGPTGTGKSTSLAAIINEINQTTTSHIVTLEDPIEFTYKNGTGLVRQRQMNDDFTSFPEALRSVLRQDPDVVMVGEMRDLETISTALTLAETGHLIFATLHTPNASQTVDRIVDVFPPHQQTQIRMQLSLTLRGIVAQRLLPGADGGRIAQREVLKSTMAVANIIREGRTQELPSVMQTNIKNGGMCTFEHSAKDLLEKKLITKEVCKWAEIA
ncbi:PilT/PilU family type 4a pilus ATPase [Candidatus Peregrinibacteria bacterium]|jgi:twitching motility protein PilT|nr:PilT/PilU family type 4a pilus ATPase [Candidatus Peregrinibacteria bacterium]MBT3598861.1 PilT/PilU family type 4a pilus ATPase [Candidatus Peregrinibacteria bacterium]MBT4366797.1 PilT/PilU family type 4a pilus ATPase [Candidatus Peregrinibacteria bacterium]MBT4585930.1 PilT/PilU family type 4a pilus ATPase [Candidatus Peregrinibacteria bacterium]MBT6731090.1 PilT/PilU family type 4a pilus ATPase [Candidatus Peregrinibacteria bacterium]